jgi:sortase A
VSLGEILTGSKEQVLTAVDPNFSILIPKIGASERITPNVDSTNTEEYLTALQTSVAHAKGSVFPGFNGNVYLFAHSTDNWWNVGRYNAVFYLLKDLVPGDEIVVFFEGKRFNYVVKQNWVGEATEVNFLRDSQGGEQKLILQTCWPPGTTWKRIFVEAVPASM